MNEFQRAVIYCRVSTEEQAREGESLDSQQRRCMDFASRHGYKVVEKFIERGQSGRTSNRTQFQKMYQYVLSQKVATIICLKIDRFMRNAGEYAFITQALRKKGIRVLFVEGTNQDDAQGHLLQGIAANFAQFESEVNSERTKAGNAQAFLSGRWIKKVCGYSFQPRQVGAEIKKVLCPNDKAKYIVKAFEMMSKGIYSQRDVIRELKKDGFTLWPQTLSKILTNPVYCGILPDYHNVNNGHSVKGIHEALVSEEVFNKVQDIIKGKRPVIVPRLRNNPDFPLRRYVICPKCGRKLTGSKHRGASGHYGYYYWCQNKGCHYSLRKKDLEPKFLEYLQSVTPLPEILKLFECLVLDKFTERTHEQAEQQKRLRKRLEELSTEKSGLIRLLGRGSLHEQDIMPEIDKINAEMAVLETEIARSNELFNAEECWSFAKYFLTNMAGLWEKGDIDLRQRMQSLIIPEGFVFEDGIIKPIKNPYFISIFSLKNKDCKAWGG